MTRKIIKITLVLLCMIGIFLFSSDTAEESSAKSDGLIVRVGEFITGHKFNSDEKDEVLEKFVFIVRKGAHFSIYLVLGFLLISLVLEYIPLNKISFLISLGIGALYAVSDEVHQAFVPGRSCEVRDMIIDTSGVLVGILLYSLSYKMRRKKYE